MPRKPAMTYAAAHAWEREAARRGVSMMQVAFEGEESRRCTVFEAFCTRTKVYYYTGIVLPWTGSDGEPLMIAGSMSPAKKSDYDAAAGKLRKK